MDRLDTKDLFTYTANIQLTSTHLARALSHLAKQAEEPLKSHLITLSAAAELCADKATKAKELTLGS